MTNYLDLSGLDLYKIELNDASLIGVNLKSTNLKGADLRGAKLREANLDLEQTNLEDIIVDEATDFSGVKNNQNVSSINTINNIFYLPKSEPKPIKLRDLRGHLDGTRATSDLRKKLEKNILEPLRIPLQLSQND